MQTQDTNVTLREREQMHPQKSHPTKVTNYRHDTPFTKGGDKT